MNRYVTTLAVLAAVCCVAPASVAQDTERQTPRSGNASAARPADEGARPQLTNVKVEITITDAMGSLPPQRKTVSMLIADGRMGRIRSTREPHPGVLNVDATPTIQGDLIRLQLALEYSPPLMGDAATRVSHVNEFVTLLVSSGKATQVSQAADPSFDRRVAVEVTATVLK